MDNFGFESNAISAGVAAGTGMFIADMLKFVFYMKLGLIIMVGVLVIKIIQVARENG